MRDEAQELLALMDRRFCPEFIAEMLSIVNAEQVKSRIDDILLRYVLKDTELSEEEISALHGEVRDLLFPRVDASVAQ